MRDRGFTIIELVVTVDDGLVTRIEEYVAPGRRTSGATGA